MPRWIFLVQLAWSAVLFAVFIAFVRSKDQFGLPESFGSVPVEAPWLGAVGGLLASLGGIVRYSGGQWNPRFNYWHPIKPLMAAVTGGVACLLVIVLARTATAGSIKNYDSAALDGAAFVFGYAESSFRELIKAITNVFLRPGESTQIPKERSTTAEQAPQLALESKSDE